MLDREWEAPAAVLDELALDEDLDEDEEEDDLDALGVRVRARTKAVEQKREPQAYPCKCGCGEIITWKGVGRKPRFVDNSHARRARRDERNRQTVHQRQDPSRFAKDQVAYLKTNTRNSGKRVKR